MCNYCGNLPEKPNVHWDVHWNVHWRTLERTLAYTGKTQGFGHGAQNASGLARTSPRRPECERARADAAPLSSSVQNASRLALDAISQNAGGPVGAPPRRAHAPRYMGICICARMSIIHECMICEFLFGEQSQLQSSAP